MIWQTSFPFEQIWIGAELDESPVGATPQIEPRFFFLKIQIFAAENNAAIEETAVIDDRVRHPFIDGAAEGRPFFRARVEEDHVPLHANRHKRVGLVR